jgi:hypothetical protein
MREVWQSTSLRTWRPAARSRSVRLVLASNPSLRCSTSDGRALAAASGLATELERAGMVDSVVGSGMGRPT